MILFDALNSKTGLRMQPRPVFFAGLSIFLVATVFMFGTVLSALSFALFLAPVWLPALVIRGAWIMWIDLKRGEFIASQEYILLEIKPPRSIENTPLAMEAVIDGLHLDPGESNWYKVFVQGGIRPYWSLELASIEGQVHFFIWTRAGFRRLIESQVYAQYPGAQVVEAPYYTRRISARTGEWDLFGCDYKHTNPDPYPIKTYVDYGLDKTQKEPEQTDPLANLIEFLGSFGKGEQFWLQIIIRVHKGDKYHKRTSSGAVHTWRDEAQKIITHIRRKTRDPYIDPATGEERPGFPNPTKGQAEAMAAIERNIAKHPFDVGIRALYLAEAGGQFKPVVIASMKALFKQFSSQSYNGIGWNGARGLLRFDDYPWEIGVSKEKEKERRELVDAHRRRQYFHAPYAYDDYMVMSTEELATLYHIPSRAVAAPSLDRISSATSEAPPNLPI